MQLTAISSAAQVTVPLLTQAVDAPTPAASAAPAAAATLPPALEITYSFDKELNQIIFTLSRPDTGQVVRQVPPNAVLEFAAYIRQQTAPAMDAKI
jgi:hypothetical protein